MPRTFEVNQLPISRRRLQTRLGMLRPQDAEVVDQLQRFLHWDRHPAGHTDREIQQEYERLMQTIQPPVARGIIAYRMDVRTITSALRRRRLGMPPPAGVGQWVEQIRMYWEDPDFRLGRQHPWVSVARRHLEANESLQVEQQLLRATWTHWSRMADRFHFSFETVLLYLARWEIIDRWTRLSASLGKQRFDTLLTETLGDYVDSF